MGFMSSMKKKLTKTPKKKKKSTADLKILLGDRYIQMLTDDNHAREMINVENVVKEKNMVEKKEKSQGGCQKSISPKPEMFLANVANTKALLLFPQLQAFNTLRHKSLFFV